MRDTLMEEKFLPIATIDYILSVLEAHQCDAVWPGWGLFLKTHNCCKVRRERIVFLGPSSETMFQLGDKIAAKYLAQASGVPLTPWAECEKTCRKMVILEHGNHIGYPLMVKSWRWWWKRDCKGEQPENCFPPLVRFVNKLQKYLVRAVFY